MKIFTESEWLQTLFSQQSPQRDYLAMYSSWVGGVVRSPNLMLVPIDDHLVHRGDGVFEAIRLIQGKIYLLDEHLNRLKNSAETIGLKSRWSLEEMKGLVRETLQVVGERDAMIRIFLSRGAGDFSTNPYTTLGSELYIVVTKFHSLPEEKYVQGVSIAKSQVPAKPGFFSQMKSCNYLPNVLMKKEAVDLGFDFAIGTSDEGFILESSTENLIYIDSEGYLIRPQLSRILKGCTMMRVCELAREISEIKGIREEDRPFTDLFQAQEIMMVGTTLDVLPVTSVEEELVGGRDGAGPLAKELLRRLRDDQISS